TDTDFFRSAGDFRGRKGSLYEGGVRVPCIVRWKGTISPGGESTRVTGFEDWLPTLLDLIGAHDAIPPGLDGVSFAATLLGQEQPPRPFLYREIPEYGGQQSVRVGDWKAVRQRLNPGPKAPLNPGPVELYDLRRDPAESTDVSASHPERVAELTNLLKQQHDRSDIFPMRALDE
ncbi:MAG: sulfatase-like hydrolase/transferase, partial [Planctomycetes bacterium]|nr:sulfatase-like hydrolase/transferase [Planctomycetota bacterium]